MLCCRGQQAVGAGYLAYSAALAVPVLVEGEHALGAHQVHGLLSIWEGVLNAYAVVLLHGVKEAVRLWIEAPCVQTAHGTTVRSGAAGSTGGAGTPT